MSAREYFDYMVDKLAQINQKAIDNGKEPQYVYSQSLMDCARQAISNNVFDETVEGPWDSLEMSENPAYQQVVCNLVTWRKSTCIEELTSRRLSTVQDEAQRTQIQQTITNMGVEDLLQAPDFQDIVHFVLTQARREEVVQVLSIEGDIPTYQEMGFNIDFHAILFANVDEAITYANSLLPETVLAIDPHNVASNLYNGSDINTAMTALRLFTYLKEATRANNLPDTCARLIDFVKKGYEQDAVIYEIVDIILPRLGIPIHEVMNKDSELCDYDVQKLAEYVGKFFSDMNLTHMRGE